MGQASSLWEQSPAMTRWLVASYPTVYLVNGILGSTVEAYGYFLGNFGFFSFDKAVNHGCVWTLFTAPFMPAGMLSANFLFTLFWVFSMMQLFPPMENAVGSTSFILWIIILSSVINLIFGLGTFFLSLLGRIIGLHFLASLQLYPTNGLTPLMMYFLTSDSLSDPEGQRVLFGVFPVKKMWYGPAIVGLFCLLSKALLWDLIAAVGVAYLHKRGLLPLDMLQPSKSFVGKVENSCCVLCRTRGIFGGTYVSGSSGSRDIESGAPVRFATLNTVMAPQSSSQGGGGGGGSWGGSSGFVAFGGGGNTLGGGDTSTGPPPSAPSVGPPPSGGPRDTDRELVETPLMQDGRPTSL